MNRRHFLATSAAAGTALMAPPAVLATPARTKSYAVFSALPPGAVRAEGWLGLYLQKQAEQLGYHLPDVSEPFSQGYWEGFESDDWWGWEQRGYWIDGAARLALVIGDRNLLARARAPIDYTLTHADSDGYLGAKSTKWPANKSRQPDGWTWHRWPHNVFFRGLHALYAAQPNAATAQAVRRHIAFDAAAYGSYGKFNRDLPNVENVLWCYQATGDPGLLALAERSWRDYQQTVAAHPDWAAEFGDLVPERVLAGTAIDSHGVTYAEVSKIPALLFMYTGDRQYLRFSQAADERVFAHHLLPDGMPSCSERYAGTTSLDTHETCDMSDHTWNWGYMLMATGDGMWADRIERVVLNAGFGAIKKDWKGVQYFSGPNQMISGKTPDIDARGREDSRMAYQPNPGGHVGCCAGNVHRLFPNYAIRMWMRSAGGGLAAMLYGPSTLNTQAGLRQQPVRIVQETNYPFDERITLRIHTEDPVTFPLSLRIPGWCASPAVALNGHEISVARETNGFVTLHRTFKDGDVVTLEFPMGPVMSTWPEKGVAFGYGPLAFALPIDVRWTPYIREHYSNADYPSWNADPATDWNYGVPVPWGEHVAVEVEKTSMTDDPWLNPPTRLKVPGKTLSGWQLQTRLQQSVPQGEKKKTYTYTPGLPDDRTTIGDAQTLQLVPYGSTTLRVAVFPQVPTES